MKYTLLICTVGGSPEPIVVTMKYWKPNRVYFVPSRESQSFIEDKVLPLARSESLDLDPGRYQVIALPDGQDFAACVERLRDLGPVVEEWLRSGSEYQVVVDFTAGTKCMSAALAIQARRWQCVFSYVGGTERSKEGVGVVLSGKEQILYHVNPWDALGFQAIEDFTALFDQLALTAAIEVVKRTILKVSQPRRKREFQSLILLAEAYDAWDQFDHKSAASKFRQLEKYENDLQAALGSSRARRIIEICLQHQNYLNQITIETGPSLKYVTDLLGNAYRRKKQRHYDDAVARLYRAIEAIAQVALIERHGISKTKSVPLDKIPEHLRPVWEVKATEGVVQLGLQDAYKLLLGLDDYVGIQFQELKLHEQNSPLASRNQSILAHGFQRVSESVFDELWHASLTLADVKESELPIFPEIGCE